MPSRRMSGIVDPCWTDQFSRSFAKLQLSKALPKGPKSQTRRISGQYAERFALTTILERHKSSLCRKVEAAAIDLLQGCSALENHAIMRILHLAAVNALPRQGNVLGNSNRAMCALPSPIQLA